MEENARITSHLLSQAKIDKINAQAQDGASSGASSGASIVALQKAKAASKTLASKVRAAPKL